MSVSISKFDVHGGWSSPGEFDEAGGSRVVIDIIAQDAGCELMLTHELPPDWSDYADRTKAAWSKMLEVLSNQLERDK
jgi:hypothetical protein